MVFIPKTPTILETFPKRWSECTYPSTWCTIHATTWIPDSLKRVITFVVLVGCDRVHSKPSQVWIRGGLAFGIHLTYTLTSLRAEKHTFNRK